MGLAVGFHLSTHHVWWQSMVALALLMRIVYSFKLTGSSPFGFQFLDSRNYAHSPERVLCAITGPATLSKSGELKNWSWGLNPIAVFQCFFYSTLWIKGFITWDSIPSLITKALVAVVLASFRFQQYPTDCQNFNAHSDCLLMFGESTSGWMIVIPSIPLLHRSIFHLRSCWYNGRNLWPCNGKWLKYFLVLEMFHMHFEKQDSMCVAMMWPVMAPTWISSLRLDLRRGLSHIVQVRVYIDAFWSPKKHWPGTSLYLGIFGNPSVPRLAIYICMCVGLPGPHPFRSRFPASVCRQDRKLLHFWRRNAEAGGEYVEEQQIEHYLILSAVLFSLLLMPTRL